MAHESKNISDLDCGALARLDKKDKLGNGLEGLVFRTCGEVPPSPRHKKVTLKEDTKGGDGEKCELPVAIKWGHYYFEKNDNALFDARIGSAVTRDIMDKGESINFVRQLSWKKCPYAKPKDVSRGMKALGEVYQIFQLMDMTFCRYFEDNRLSERDWFNCLFQVAHASLKLEENDIFNFDMHCNNVLVKFLDVPITLVYSFKGKRVEIKNVRFTLHVTDFGHTRSDKHATYVTYTKPGAKPLNPKTSSYGRKGREAPLLKFYTSLEPSEKASKDMGRIKDFLEVRKYPNFYRWLKEGRGIPELYPENQLTKLIRRFPEFVTEAVDVPTDPPSPSGKIAKAVRGIPFYPQGPIGPTTPMKPQAQKASQTSDIPAFPEVSLEKGPEQKLMTCNGVTLPAEACMKIHGVEKHFTSQWNTYIGAKDRYWSRQELLDFALTVGLPDDSPFIERDNFEDAMTGLKEFLDDYAAMTPTREIQTPQKLGGYLGGPGDLGGSRSFGR